MKKNMLIIAIIHTLFLSILNAQQEPTNTRGIASFSGQITTDDELIKLRVYYTSFYITGGGKESESFDVPVDKNGRFNFVIPGASTFSRLSVMTLFNGVAYRTISNGSLVEPGDNITINAYFEGEADSIRFSGRGAGKFSKIFSYFAAKISYHLFFNLTYFAR